MLGLGFWELVLLGIIALLVVGPDQLPHLARNLARFINELKRSTDDFKRELNTEEFISNSQVEENKEKAKSASLNLSESSEDQSHVTPEETSADIYAEHDKEHK